jgi:hypothetical protein
MPGWFQSGGRIGNIGATALLALVPVFCAAADPHDQCIVSDGAIGCISERATIDLAAPRKDAGAIRDVVRQKLDSGQCRRFGYGERVHLISSKGTGVGSKDTERNAVRRIGDRTIYWLPASWTRPASECEPHASSATLQAKIGMSDNTIAQESGDSESPDEIANNGTRDRLADRGDAMPRIEDERHEGTDRQEPPTRNDAADSRGPPNRTFDADRYGYAWRLRDSDRNESDRYRRVWDRRNPAYSRDRYADDRSQPRDDDDRYAREEPRSRGGDARFARDDRYLSPRRYSPPDAPAQRAPLASSTYAHRYPSRDAARARPCVYKPVMTRDDLAACTARER